jgi:hypothetical protein
MISIPAQFSAIVVFCLLIAGIDWLVGWLSTPRSDADQHEGKAS